MATSDDPVLVRRTDELVDETWPAVPGGTSWRTLFDRESTGTEHLATGVATIPVGGALPAHRHPVPECYFVLSGEGRVRLGDAHHDVSAGTSVMVPADEVHGARNTGETPLRIFYVFSAGSLSDVEYDFC